MKTFNYSIDKEDVEKIINFSQFKDKKNILIQIFCGHNKDYLEKLIFIILKNLPKAILIASSTDGEINNENISTYKTVVSISVFEDTTLISAYEDNIDGFKNGKNIASKLITSNTKLLIIFSDGALTNGEALLKGVESINNNIIVAGGMAGDNASFTQTFVACQDKILTSGVVGVSLNSTCLTVCNSYNFNWSPIGINHTIDEVKDNRVYKISGLTPLEFYEKYLGEYVAKTLPATGIEFPLIVQRNGLPLARAVINKHKDGSLSFAGNLYKGDIVKLGFGNVELIMDNPYTSFFKECQIKNTQSFFIYSCMARRRFMPDLIDLEIKPFAKIAQTSGFFTYGEFYHNKNQNELLNQTLTVIALSEGLKKEENKKLKIDNNFEISDYARSLQALTHLVEQSSKDYNEQSKKLEERQIYVQKLLNSQKQFLKHAVHETNTPLSIIMGNIEMFEMEFGKNKYLNNIEVALKNLSSIYDDLSYLIKKDKVNEATHKINLVDFLRSRIEFFSPSAIKAKTNFNFTSKQKEIFINFNEIKLQRIVDNNLTNAIKYTLDNKIINVKLENFNNTCELIIESNSKQILDPQKIFEEYYREETNVQEGFGLGLNLVKRICSEENVGIRLESGENWASFIYTFKEIQ